MRCPYDAWPIVGELHEFWVIPVWAGHTSDRDAWAVLSATLCNRVTTILILSDLSASSAQVVMERLKLVTDRLSALTKSCPLEGVSNSFLEICPVVSTQSQLLAVLENDPIFTVKPWLEFLDLVDLDDG